MAAKSHEAAEHLKDALVEQAEQVRDRAQSAKEQTADRIRSVATQLRNMSDTLRADDPMAATVADRASQGIEGLARYVNATTAQSFVRDTEQLARRQPTLFFGGAFLLGLTAARFLKSSRPSTDYSGASRVRRDSDVYALEDNQKDRSPSYLGREGATTNPQRYRQNYDAAFARDTDEPERYTISGTAASGVGANSAGTGSVGTSTLPGTGTEGKSQPPARKRPGNGNGGGPAGKGNTP